MQVTISARHGHLSDASRKKIEAKVSRLTRIFDRLTSIIITIDLEHEEQPAVDLQVASEHKHDFVATDRSASLMGSIDTVVHRMESQLRKYKDKIQHRHRGTGEHISATPAPEEELDKENTE
ncbi:MAG: ribosome-associated translation inhibitor RaiA [Pirellulales bacterium]|nr:ribosome-associated translation inhibitor RaiA [Pirellulales bacterium]HJN65965.1 ribosome-associated translation inhibitor RaiA [Pirellulales bacterium]